MIMDANESDFKKVYKDVSFQIEHFHQDKNTNVYEISDGKHSYPGLVLTKKVEEQLKHPLKKWHLVSADIKVKVNF